MSVQSNIYDELKKALPQVIADSYGNITIAAKKSGIARETIYRWMKEDPGFAQEVEDARWLGREFFIDEAEILHRKHSQTTPTSVIYSLNSKQGRARGWGDKGDSTLTVVNKSTKTDDEVIAEYMAKYVTKTD